MFTEAHYQAVLKFFYFMLLDESLALAAALDTVKRIQTLLKKAPTLKMELLLIDTMQAVLVRYRKRQRHLVLTTPAKSEFKISNLDHLVRWKEFMKKSDDQINETLVLRYILDYTPDLIAEGLGVPVGTVFYRIRHGLEAFSGVR